MSSVLVPVIWEKCLQRLELKLPEAEFHTWLRPIEARYTDEVLYLHAPNRYALEYIRKNLLHNITETAHSVLSRPVEIRIETRPSAGPAKGLERKPVTQLGGTENTKLPFGFGRLNPLFTFDNHVPGDSNKVGRVITEQVGEAPGSREYNPLFIYGKVGIGKTHLMQAAGHRMLQLKPNANIGYVQATNFVNHIVTLFKKKDEETIQSFKLAYHSLDALLIDDVHMFAGASASQQEFLNTFNALLEGQKQIIVTSDVFFKEISNVESRLKSRLGQGVTIRIRPPEFETRIAILEKKAELKRIALPRQVAYFIAEKVKSSVRELEGALHQLIAYHRFMGHPITVDLAKKVLSDLLEYNSKPIDIAYIQKTVANYYNIRVEDMLSRSRKTEYTVPRQIAMMLSRQLTEQSLPKIGEQFGGRNHATILHACTRVEQHMKSNPKIANEVDVLRNMLSP